MKKDIYLNNNVSLIKFILAFLVIFSHAFPIALGVGNVDPVNTLTNGQLDLGNFSVCIFLLFSGYFIVGSVERSKSAKEFFIKRIKRIIPPLFIVLLFTVFIVGPIFTTVTPKEYFMDGSPYLYLIKNTFLITTHKIIGLWDNNPYPLSTNGALWTLSVEFLCYIVCYIGYRIKIINKKNLKYTIIPFSIVFLFQSMLYKYFPILEIVLPLFMLFYMGAFFYIYRDYIKLDGKIAVLFIIITITSLFVNLYAYVKIITLPYIFFWLAFKIKNRFTNKKWYNVFKLSYEIYLLGWLIQQIVYYLTKNSNPYVNFCLAIVPVIILAILLNKITKILLKEVKK